MNKIIEELEASIPELDTLLISDKFKLISDKNRIINDNLEKLKKMESDVLTYNPNPIEIVDLDTCMKQIEDGCGIFENETLEDSIKKYYNLMNKIYGIEKYITQTTDDYIID